MTDRRPFSPDLPRHAADKVKRTLDDVLQLTDDPSEMLRIALMAAGVPIGAASGILAAMASKGGEPVSELDAKLEILRLLGTALSKGTDAALSDLTAGALGEQAPREPK